MDPKVREEQRRIKAGVPEKQAASLAFLNDDDRAFFLAEVNSPDLVHRANDFLNSVAQQFHMWGKLSEKQVNGFLRACRNFATKAERKAAQVAKVSQLTPVAINEIVVVRGKVIWIEDNAESRSGYISTKYVVLGVDGTRYNIKTNSKKLGPIFRNAKEAGTELKFEGQVIWVTDDRCIISLLAKTVKFID